jgi:SAM-dependent methyltransferase
MIPFQLHRRIPLVRRPFYQRDRALAERDQAVAQRNTQFSERNLALAERDRAHVERDQAFVERDGALVERDQAFTERDQAMAERDAEFSERAFPGWLMRTLQLPPYFFNIDGFSIVDSAVEFTGWALPWRGLPFNRTLLREDGVRVDMTSTVNKDLAHHYPYWANAATAPFSARTEIGPGSADYISVESVDISGGSSLAHPLEQFSRRFFVPVTKDLPVPPANIIAHVGESTADYYLMSGCTLFNGFKSAFERYAGRPFDTARRILDWGCGPGRVGLHLVNEIRRHAAATEYVGVDIDEMSLAWAEQTIEGKFVHTQRMPPLPFPDGHFDFIFGYSVFTHLDDLTQKAWLAELRRLCSPGGLVAVTVMSELALFYGEPYLSEAESQARLGGGIFDSMPNDQLEESGIDGDYYKNVWMTKDYIKNRWAETFDVVAVHANFHHYQDLVVLRAR